MLVLVLLEWICGQAFEDLVQFKKICINISFNQPFTKIGTLTRTQIQNEKCCETYRGKEVTFTESL